MRALLAAFSILLLACQTDPAPRSDSADTQGNQQCTVTTQQREAARKLDWQAFDQVGGAPGTFRDLANKGCNTEALAAYDDWLANGPGFPDVRARGIGNFHRGQVHAFLGRDREALALFAEAGRTEGPDDPRAYIWNIYLDGVIGFFEGDGDAISRAIAVLNTIDDRFAERQVGVLTGLRTCLGRPYAEAMSPECQDAGD